MLGGSQAGVGGDGFVNRNYDLHRILVREGDRVTGEQASLKFGQDAVGGGGAGTQPGKNEATVGGADNGLVAVELMPAKHSQGHGGAGRDRAAGGAILQRASDDAVILGEHHGRGQEQDRQGEQGYSEAGQVTPPSRLR